MREREVREKLHEDRFKVIGNNGDQSNRMIVDRDTSSKWSAHIQ